VLIMTSNVGAGEVRSGKSLGFVQDAAANFAGIKSKLMDSLRKTFSPEFLNRLDESIVFRPLDKSDMGEIVEILLKNFMKRLRVLEMDVDFNESAKKFLIEKGFDPALGARPLKRAIQRHLEDPLSELLLKQGVGRDAEIHVEAGNDELEFKVISKSEKDGG